MSNSFKSYLYAFLAGFILVGFLDWFHTYTGVQHYLIDQFAVSKGNWPWFLPFQMGIAGVSILVFWNLFEPKVLDKIMESEIDTGPGTIWVILISCIMIIGGYLEAWNLQDDPHHLTCYLIPYILSIIYVALFHTRRQVLIFIIVGIMGILVESSLLKIGYFEYQQKDLFGLAPAWLLLVYGWVGMFIYRLYVFGKN